MTIQWKLTLGSGWEQTVSCVLGGGCHFLCRTGGASVLVAQLLVELWASVPDRVVWLILRDMEQLQR